MDQPGKVANPTRGQLNIDIASQSVYGTTIRGCGVVDTIYQVVKSTYGYTWGFYTLATGKRAYSSQNKTFFLELVLLY